MYYGKKKIKDGFLGNMGDELAMRMGGKGYREREMREKILKLLSMP